jgi:hypothetical protein
MRSLLEKASGPVLEANTWDDKKADALLHQLQGNSTNALKALELFKKNPDKYAPQLDNVVNYLKQVQRDVKVMRRHLEKK